MESKRPKSSLASLHRRLGALDMNRSSSSSLNISTSSLRSSAGGEEMIKKRSGAPVQAGRRAATTVRFAPPPPSSSSSAAAAAAAVTTTVTRSSRPASSAAPVRPGTAAGRRPASASGPSPGSKVRGSMEPGPKAARRSWGWTSGTDGKEPGSGGPAAEKAATVRSSSVPRRLPAEDEKGKPVPKRSSKVSTTPRRNAHSDSPHQPDMEGDRSPSNVPRKTGDPKTMKVSPTRRTSVTTIGAAWESLPPELQSLGLEVMRYRDDAEDAAVEALQEASAAEILLRCLSACADLTSAAAEQSPQQTVDEFLALHAALTTSSSSSSSSAAAAAGDDDDKQDRRAAVDWLRAAVSTDLAPFALFSPAPKPSRAASRGGDDAASPTPASTRRRRPAAGGGAEEEEAWLAAARRGLGAEVRAWFLGHVERLLDGNVAGTLGQLKRVNDWLDAAGERLPSPETEAVERVRKKIYRYLLDHVESAVVALNGGGAAGRRK
ncbi:hypothetical protein ACP4OV_013157 [Aristida adscensionis]